MGGGGGGRGRVKSLGRTPHWVQALHAVLEPKEPDSSSVELRGQRSISLLEGRWRLPVSTQAVIGCSGWSGL